ncbi:MAG: ABC transporter permease [Nitrososphaerota archaeon]
MRTNSWALKIISFITIITLWQIVSLIAGEFFVPSPIATISAFIKLIISGELPKALLFTIQVLLLGFVASLVIGIVSGLILGWFKPLGMALEPYINALNSTPHIVFIPIIILWLGIDVEARIFYVLFASIFPIIINTMYGVKYCDENLIETAKAYHASQREILTKVVLPGSLPFIMSGLKIGLARSIISVIISEMFFKLAGTGALILKYGDLFRLDAVFAIIIAIIILTQSIFKITDIAEKRAARWRQE